MIYLLRNLLGVKYPVITLGEPTVVRDHTPCTWIYGDSFVHRSPGALTWYYLWSRDFSDLVVNQSQPGSGMEHAVMTWLRDHQQQRHRPGDRVLISLSEISRQYQSNLANVNANQARNPRNQTPQWQAIRSFYLHMAPYQWDLWPIRQQSLCLWLDRELAHSPAETFVAWSFGPAERFDLQADLDTHRDLYRFQNARNIWPALSYYSVTDPHYPGSIAHDPRAGHVSDEQHLVIYRKLTEAQAQGGDCDLES